MNILLLCMLNVIGTCMGRPCVLRNSLPCAMKDNVTDTGDTEKPVNVQIKVLSIQWVYMFVGISSLCLFVLIAVTHRKPGYEKDTTETMFYTPDDRVLEISIQGMISTTVVRPNITFYDPDIDDAEPKKFGRTEMLSADMEKESD